MKKKLTTLVLFIFCTIQIIRAEDIILLNSESQFKRKNIYAEQNNKTSKQITDIKQPEKNMNLSENAIDFVNTTINGKNFERTYYDKKGHIVKIIKGVLDEDDKSEIGEKSNIIHVITEDKEDAEKFWIDNKVSQVTQVYGPETEKKYSEIVQNAPKILENTDSILKQYKYTKKGKIKKKYTKMDLQDGDYIIGFKNAQYFAEYHQDGTLMGLVKIDTETLNEKNINVAFYEYRTGYNTNDTNTMGLKHVLFLNYEEDTYIFQFIYKYDGTLLCKQINHDIYVSNDAKNILPDWSEMRNTQNISILQEFNNGLASFLYACNWTPLGIVTVFLTMIHSTVAPDAYKGFK